MQCEQARQMLLEGPLKKGEREQTALRQHLESCPGCRDDERGMRALAELTGQWREEPVPEWDRLPWGFVRQPQPGGWLRWAPLAACLLLTLLVAMRMEITAGKDGFRIAFGGVAEAASDEEWRQVLGQALRQHQIQTAAQVQTALIQFRGDQEAQFDGLALKLTDYTQQERAADLQLLMEQWQTQRDADLTLVEQRIQTLMARQNRQGNQLYGLANYVKNVPRYANSKAKENL